MNYKVETIPSFDRELKKLTKKHLSLKGEITILGKLLETDPEQGTAIGKGCYKIRLAIKSKGRGKSGGARVITCVVAVDERVILLSIYDKADQTTVTDAFLNHLLDEAGL